MLVILSVDSEKLMVEELVPLDSLIGVELQQRPDEFLALKTHFYVRRKIDVFSGTDFDFVLQVVVVFCFERRFAK